MQADDGIECRKLQLVGRDRIACRAEHFQTRGDPGDRRAGFDRSRIVRVADGLLSRRKAAVVVPIELHDAPPDMLEGLSIIFFAGDTIKFGEADNRVQAFPPRLRRRIKLLPGQRRS